MAKLSFLDQLNEEQLEYARRVGEKAKEMGIPPALAISIAYHESRLNPNVGRGSSGEFGIMQVMPNTGKGMGYTNKDLADPDKNIEAGLKYLKKNYDEFGGDARLATIGYNAGTNSPFFSGGELPKVTEDYLKAMKGYGAYAAPSAQPQAAEAQPTDAQADEPQETDEVRDARIQAAIDAQEKRQAQIVGAGVGAGISGAKVLGSGAGSVIQAGAKRAGEGFRAGMQGSVPPGSSLPQTPTGPTSGEKWAAKTGYGKGQGTVQDVSSRYQRAIGQGKVSGRMDKLFGPALDGESPQLSQRLIDRAKAAEVARMPPPVSGLEAVNNTFRNMMRPLATAVSTVGRYVVPPLALANIAGEGVNIQQQLRKPEDQRDLTSAGLSATGILGTGMALANKNPYLGGALAAGSALTQEYRNNPEMQEYLRQKMQGMARHPLLDEMTGPLP
jgi:hypothetical protein